MALDDERRLMERQINLYKENYVHITEQIEETRKLRHDMRQHFRVINDFANNRQFDKIAEYLEEYSSETMTQYRCSSVKILRLTLCSTSMFLHRLKIQ